MLRGISRLISGGRDADKFTPDWIVAGCSGGGNPGRAHQSTIERIGTFRLGCEVPPCSRENLLCAARD